MEEMQNEEGLSLLEIIRILFHKLKLLILVVIIGAVCGAAFGVWKTKNVKYYGTSIEFYVNPEKPKAVGSSSNSTANAVGSQYGVYGAYGRHVMDAIVKLLSSESFAEQLMLDEESGLPSTKIYPNLDEEKYNNAKHAIAAANAAWEDAVALDQPRAAALENLQEFWNNTQVDTFSLSNCKKLINAYKDDDSKYSEDGKIMMENMKTLYENYLEADDKRTDALMAAEAVQQTTDTSVELLLENWRSTSKYKENLNKFKDAVSYSYLDDEGAKEEDANNLARSFIYVNINVLNDKAFAEDLLDRVKVAVPAYIEKNMIVPADYEGTSCTRITRSDSIQQTNPNYTRNQAIKFSVLLAAAAGVIAAFIVIIIDLQDKRLRDHEVISRKFKIPVLGIVPTIEEMNQAVENKKLEEKRRNKEARK